MPRYMYIALMLIFNLIVGSTLQAAKLPPPPATAPASSPKASSASPAPSATSSDPTQLINESASPLLPLFGANAGDKSKFANYQTLLPTLSEKTDHDLLLKALKGFHSDVVVKTLQTSQLTFVQLDQVNAALDQLYKRIIAVESAIKKTKAEGAEAQKLKEFQAGLVKRVQELKQDDKRLEAKIKRQKDMHRYLETIGAMPFDKKIAEFRKISPVVFVDPTLISSVKQEALVELGRVVGEVKDAKATKEIATIKVYIIEPSVKHPAIEKEFKDKLVELNTFLSAAAAAIAAAKKATGAAVAPTGGVSTTTPTSGVVTPTPTAGVATTTAVAGTAQAFNFDALKKDLSIKEQKDVTTLLNACISLVANFAQVLAKDRGLMAAQILEKMLWVFSNREKFNLDMNQRELLRTLVESLEKTQPFSSQVQKRVVVTVKAAVVLKKAQEKKHSKESLDVLRELVPFISPDLDTVEQNKLDVLLINIFRDRKLTPQMPEKKLQEKIALCGDLRTFYLEISPKKIFRDAQKQQTVEQNIKILDAGLVLVGLFKEIYEQKKIKPIKEQFSIVSPHFGAIALRGATSEQAGLYSLMQLLFENRGNYKKDDLSEFLSWVRAVLKVAALFDAAKRTTIMQWEKDINDSALKETDENKTYTESLAAHAVAKKDIEMHHKAMKLITGYTPQEIKTVYVQTLKQIWDARATYDQKALSRYLQALYGHKVGNLYLMYEDSRPEFNQRGVLKNWIDQMAVAAG